MSVKLGEESNACMFYTATQEEAITNRKKKSARNAVRLLCAPIGAIIDLIYLSMSFLCTHGEGRLGKSV